jgi:hypothetical protein
MLHSGMCNILTGIRASNLDPRLCAPIPGSHTILLNTEFTKHWSTILFSLLNTGSQFPKIEQTKMITMTIEILLSLIWP